jgi:hypothetical protein
MFTIDGTKASFTTFAQAADCATVHARQRGEALIRNVRTGALLADFRPMADGTVSVAAIGAGKALVEEWAR